MNMLLIERHTGWDNFQKELAGIEKSIQVSVKWKMIPSEIIHICNPHHYYSILSIPCLYNAVDYTTEGFKLPFH